MLSSKLKVKIETRVAKVGRKTGHLKAIESTVRSSTKHIGDASHRLEDLTNKKYGRLTVLSLENPIKGRTYWLCKCECGKIKPILAQHLKSGNIVSCGNKGCKPTHSSSNKLPVGISSFNKLYTSYKKRAETKGILFNFSKDDAKKLFLDDCYYCGCKPSQLAGNKTTNGRFTYNGIDRKDNKIGYVSSNCVSCCWDCNRAKFTKSYDEFLSWIERIKNHDRK